MSAVKSSRNRQRKALYAGLADKGSRNQDTIEQQHCPKCRGVTGQSCDICGGLGFVAHSRASEAAKAVDDSPAASAPCVPKRETDVRKLRRIEAAGHRASTRADRSPREQIAELDARLGEGVGALRERARLAAMK